MSAIVLPKLVAAIQANALPEVEQLIAQFPALADATLPEGCSPPLFAAYLGSTDIAHFLLECKSFFSVFEMAAFAKDAHLEKLIHETPKLSNTHAPDGFTPLGLAARFGHDTTIDLLIRYNADVNRKYDNTLKATPLHSAVEFGHHWPTLLLLKQGADPNVQRNDAISPLHLAIQRGIRSLVQLLLGFGAEVNVKDGTGQTPLDFARKGGFPEIYAQLLEHGAQHGEEM